MIPKGFDCAEFLGVRFAHCAVDRAADWVDRASHGDSFAYVVTPNVDHMVMLHEPGSEPWRAAYADAVAASALCVNDSRILARLARLGGRDLPVCPGSDLVREIVRRRAGTTGSISLVGGRAEEAAWLRQALPGHRIAHHEPPMGVRDDPRIQAAIADFVAAEGSDIVLFAIGAPQSEIVAHAIARQRRARGVGLCIGASVEFLSGAKRRAPMAMQRAGLEWLFRLASEPRRLWRRYLVKGPRIFAIWWRERRRS